MIIKNSAISAYQNALKAHTDATHNITGKASKTDKTSSDFGDMLKGSVQKVNQMQQDKELMIEEFASGKTQNVHELMISLQKAGLAMSMTSTVRNKIMQSYQEIMRMPF